MPTEITSLHVSVDLAEQMPSFISTFDGAQLCITGVGVQALAAPDRQVEMELVVRLPD